MRPTEEDVVNAFNDFMTKMAAGNNMCLPTIVTNEIYRGNYVIRISNGCLIDVDQGLKRVNIHAPNIGDLFIDGNSFILDDIREFISDDLSSLMRQACVMYAKSIIYMTGDLDPKEKSARLKDFDEYIQELSKGK
nr:MAG TPA: hypothetical protein [Caudoviricetes sp.]